MFRFTIARRFEKWSKHRRDDGAERTQLSVGLGKMYKGLFETGGIPFIALVFVDVDWVGRRLRFDGHSDCALWRRLIHDRG